MTVTLRMAGYHSKTVTLSTEADLTQQVELTKVTRATGGGKTGSDGGNGTKSFGTF